MIPIRSPCASCGQEINAALTRCPYCDSVMRKESLEGSPAPSSSESAEEQWIEGHRDLIALLEEGGHSLFFYTFFYTYPDSEDGGGGRWHTRLRCTACRARYHDSFLGRWWGLSPERPCEGDSGV